tara:strand:- start:69 stop:350 length:282 start_codon:yes stop_codon:yes gene_type:complete
MTTKYETLIVDARLTTEEEFSDILSYMSERNAVVNQRPTYLYDEILNLSDKLWERNKLRKHRKKINKWMKDHKISKEQKEKINSIFKAQERKA